MKYSITIEYLPTYNIRQYLRYIIAGFAKANRTRVVYIRAFIQLEKISETAAERDAAKQSRIREARLYSCEVIETKMRQRNV